MAVMFSRGDKLENGHYTIIKEIGVGGMGVVYHCRDEWLLRDVAIKMLLPELMADKSNLEVFKQEARLAAKLEHPNVVTVYGIGVEEHSKKQHHYVCMEYLPGGNLANRVIAGPLAVEHCLNWMKQLAGGLTYAHKYGVVHQDIKADNIFITNEGDLKIGDFGLARLMVGRVHYNAQTKGMGTPAYMSPELCRGEPQDHRSDIYSLGILFFEMATGQLPFRARGMIEMATKHSSAPVPSAKRINPLIPEILDKVIRRMMAKTPEERYSSMSEVLTILDDLIFELRVARLGLGNRPLLRSGPVQAELMQAAAAQAAARASETEVPQEPPVQQWKPPSTTLQRTAQHKGPDTPPHTTSLPPVDPGVVQQSTAAGNKALSASEKLIAQLETEGSSKASGAPPPAREQRNSRDTFVKTGRISRDVATPRIESSTVPLQRTPVTNPQPSTPTPPAPVSPTVSPPPPPQPPSVQPPSSQAGSGAGTIGAESPRSFASRPRTPSVEGLSGAAQPAAVSPETDRIMRTSYSKLPKMKTGPLSNALKNGLELQWSFKSKGPIGWGSSPVLNKEESILYVSSADGSVYAIDTASGAPLWVNKLGSAILASPVLMGDKVIAVSSGGLICAISAADGSTTWRFDAGDMLVATPCAVKDMIIVAGAKGKILAIECQRGIQRWQYKADSGVVGAPQKHGELILLGTRGGFFHAIHSEGGKNAWRFNVGSPILASPVTSVDSVYFGSEDGNFYALEAASGGLIWEYPSEKPIVSRAAISFTSVLFGSHDKWLYCCERYDGGLKWKGALRGKVIANLVAVKDTVISVSREGWIQAFASQNGELRWQRDLGRSIESTPLVTSDRLYLCTIEGEVISYSLSNSATLAEKSA